MKFYGKLVKIALFRPKMSQKAPPEANRDHHRTRIFLSESRDIILLIINNKARNLKIFDFYGDHPGL